MKKIKINIILPFLAVFVFFFGFLLTSTTVAVEKADAYYYDGSLPVRYQFANAFRCNEQFNDNEQDRTQYNLDYDGQSGVFTTRYIGSAVSQSFTFDLGWIDTSIPQWLEYYDQDQGISIVFDENFDAPYRIEVILTDSYYLNGQPYVDTYTIFDLEEEDFWDYEIGIDPTHDYFLSLRFHESFLWQGQEERFRVGVYMTMNYFPRYTQNPNDFLEVYGDSGGSYTQGFEEGFEKGSSISTKNAYEQGLNKGYADGQLYGYDKGYSKGIEDADKGFVNAVSTVLFAPVQITKDFLNFDLLGYNMLSFFTGIITLLIIVKVVRLFI